MEQYPEPQNGYNPNNQADSEDSLMHPNKAQQTYNQPQKIVEPESPFFFSSKQEGVVHYSVNKTSEAEQSRDPNQAPYPEPSMPAASREHFDNHYSAEAHPDGAFFGTRDTIKSRISYMALASLILGILSLIAFFTIFTRSPLFAILELPVAILAVIFGALSLSNIKKSAGQLTGKRIGLCGLILGLITVVINLFAVLALVSCMFVGKTLYTP